MTKETKEINEEKVVKMIEVDIRRRKDCPFCGKLISKTLNELSKKIRETSIRKGFQTVYPSTWRDNDLLIPTKLALIHSEVSEALEAFRNDDYANFKEEIADIIIRTLDLAAGLAMNVDLIVKYKMAKNASRTKMHGGKRI